MLNKLISKIYLNMSCLQFHCDYLTRMVIVGLQSRRLTLKTHLTKTSLRTCLSENAVVLDGCAYLWSVHWSKAGNISNLFNVSKDYIVKFLHQSNVFLIFDWYHDYRLKVLPPKIALVMLVARKTYLCQLHCVQKK